MSEVVTQIDDVIRQHHRNSPKKELQEVDVLMYKVFYFSFLRSACVVVTLDWLSEGQW
jgi:hypothetical protein